MKSFTKTTLLITLLSFSLVSNAQKWNANKPANTAKPADNNSGQAPIYNQKTAVSAKSDLPNSIVNISIGFGTTYGGLGAKAVIGYRNSGLLVGLGSIYGLGLGYNIGGQISVNWWYASVSYGTYISARKIQILGLDPMVEIPVGVNIMTGAMINLGKPKRCYLDLGIGLSAGGTIKQYSVTFGRTTTITSSRDVPVFGIAVNIGFGVRLGSIPNKK